ncbi:RHS repeat-associated core domain-containing protein [Pantoea sp. Cy-639]|uniref:RHS repeat-associated core domain-containing protein n=1 Tax=Pantoea sp. Cy-639 TaxID=2608360 RepID=UPI00257006E8|nr:RHS repeat-associated core domain-containing protein [Pantoea sp. Cy-639]
MPHSLSIFQSDRQSSVMASRVDGVQRSIQYTPYGHANLPGLSRAVGYAGQLREKNFGWYMLGNGYRIYNPIIMRFHSPDRLSPFERGGENPYTYVDNDPMNFTDPDGLSKQMWVVASTVGLAKSGVGLIHNGIKSIKSMGSALSSDSSVDRTKVVMDAAGYTLKATGESISFVASAVKLSKSLREIDPTYAGVDDSASDFGLVIAYVTGQALAGVGETLLLGMTVTDLLRRFVRSDGDAAHAHQEQVNQKLLQWGPGEQQMSRDNERGSSQ